jgi:hypothetical protein
MRRSLLIAGAAFALLALGLAPARPPTALAQTSAPGHPIVWLAENDPDARTPYGWLVGYPAAALRGNAPAIAPSAVIVVPNLAIDDVAADSSGAVYAKYGPLYADRLSWLVKFAPGASGAAPHTDIGLGQRSVGDLTVDPQGNLYAVLFDARNAPALVMANAQSRTVSPFWMQGANRLFTAPDAMAASGREVVAEANHPEPPLNEAQITIVSPSSFTTVYQDTGNVSGLAYDRQGVLNALVQRNGQTQILQFVPAEGLRGLVRINNIPVTGPLGQNALAVDDDGYLYILASNHILVYAPISAGGRLLHDWPCCANAATPDGSIPVAPGLRPPNNQPKSIAVEH